MACGKCSRSFNVSNYSSVPLYRNGLVRFFLFLVNHLLDSHLHLWLQLSFREVEGDYQVLITVHSLLLLESRCAECYGETGVTIKRNDCCDENEEDSCPERDCDILLRFCQLGDLSQFNLADRLVSIIGTKCVQTPLSSHFDDWLGNNLKAGETYPEFDEMHLFGGVIFRTPVMYNEAGQWVSFDS